MILDILAAEAKTRVAKLEKQKSLAAVRAEAEQIYKCETSCQNSLNAGITETHKVETGICTDGTSNRTERVQVAKCAGKATAVRTKSFLANLQRPGLNFICECKKASPSKGLIAPEFPYLQIAKAYEAGGAAAISVLTEPEHFLGSDVYLKEIAAQVSLPVLRKDFTVSPYQIYEAKLLGAGAVLLICALLSPTQLEEYRLAAESVGLEAMVETHDAEEMEMALDSGAKVIGINNRNLKDFSVDMGTCLKLRREIPEDRICIAESGIRNKEDIRRLKAAHFNGVLIGETLMRSGNPEQMLRELREA